KAPAVRWQHACEPAQELRSALGELVDREAAEGGEKERQRDPTKTMKLDVETLKNVLPAPSAAAIGTDTRLPTSARFDCTEAFERLTSPTASDRRRLTRAPRPVGLLRRIWLEPGRRPPFVLLVLRAIGGGADRGVHVLRPYP